MNKKIEKKVKLMTLNPGHFHAALLQKTMYPQVDPVSYVYAPEGPDVVDHLDQIEKFNSRSENPTSWQVKAYTGFDYLKRLLSEKPGNVLIFSGNNRNKTEIILKIVKEGIHVLVDKPMIIDPAEFPKLEEAFDVAQRKGVILYDIMTERYEITTILQRELAQMEEVFGKMKEGSMDDPAFVMESVHHFFKFVAGSPVKRPPWFFDSRQQGESMADVGSHLVDLIQWEAFPEQILSKDDIEVISARRWPTALSREMFSKVTFLEDYPYYLQSNIDDDILHSWSNGEMVYRIKGIYAKVSALWNYLAPEGSGDIHYSRMHGTKCDLIIKQGKEECYIPELYIEINQKQEAENFAGIIQKSVNEKLAGKYPGIKLERSGADRWRLYIPDTYRVGHEAHFAQVTEKYLEYIRTGVLPEWEIPNMIVKYFTTMEGQKKAFEAQPG